MRFLFSMIIALTMAASLQAVAVAWSVQNSDWNLWNWTQKNSEGVAQIDVYVFFSGTDYSSGDYAGDNFKTAATTAATSGVKAGYSGSSSTGVSDNLQVYAANLNTGYAAGYYYMVIFENNNTKDGDYIVAQTTLIVEDSVNKDQGVYNTDAGTPPDAIQYVELDWAGGTWFAPTAPEPTVMALLALGVASLALRRKIS